MMMHNRDEVIRQAARCAQACGDTVRRTLNAYMAEQTDDTRDALRVALVAQAVGHEGRAHDGSTRDARITAAQAALDAWDGTGPLTGDQVAHTIGSTRIVASARTWEMAGFRLSQRSIDDTSLYVSGSNNTYEPLRVAQALSEGYTHEAALLRAIAIGETTSAARATDYAKIKAADLALSAAQEQVRAEAIRAKAARGNQ